MVGPLLLCALAVAPATLAPADPDDRHYDGPLEPAAPAAVDVEVANPAELEPAPPQANADVEVPPPEIPAAAGTASVTDAAAGPTARPTNPGVIVISRPPRPLATLAGWYPGEQAIHANARRTVTFIPDLQLRAVVGSVGDFSLDSKGNDYAEGPMLFGRARWRPVLTLGKRQRLTIVGMLDLANGRWAPTTADDPTIQRVLDDGHPPQSYGMYIADPRELYLQWTTRYGQLRVGQMSFSWGQGLIANDGNNMDRFGDMKFGDDGIGSLQERILFATKPLSRSGGPGQDLIVVLAADLVYRDPLADLTRGDLAGQGVLAVRWEPENRPGTSIGAYAAYRKQRYADDNDGVANDNTLEVGVFDFAGQGSKPLRGDLTILGAFEVVGIAGRTNVARGKFSRHQVLQAAAVARGFIGDPLRWLVGADAGVASGDADPDDDRINDFEAAPGFTAGLLLFQYYRGWQSAQTEILAGDPNLAGVAPNGLQYVPTRGTVTNAVYLHPKASYAFRERFEVWAGPLLAASAVPVVDVYTTKLNGGSPHNSVGGAASRRYLGTELDLGLRARYEIRQVWFQAGLQGAILFPGRAFARPLGERDRPSFAGWFRVEIRY